MVNKTHPVVIPSLPQSIEVISLCVSGGCSYSVGVLKSYDILSSRCSWWIRTNTVCDILAEVSDHASDLQSAAPG